MQVAARAAAAEAALQELRQQHEAQTRHLDEVESQRAAGEAQPGGNALHRLQWHRRSGRSRASSRSSSSGARAMRDTERQVLLAQASSCTATSGPAGNIKQRTAVRCQGGNAGAHGAFYNQCMAADGAAARCMAMFNTGCSMMRRLRQ